MTSNAVFLESVVAMPPNLIRDGSVDTLLVVLSLLENCGRSPDSSIYTGVMTALLRRKDFARVAAIGARVPPDALTAKARATLAAAAAYSGHLDESLKHIGEMSVPAEGQRQLLSSSATLQILTLAAKEGRVLTVAEHLARVGSRLEANHLQDLLSAGSRGRKGGVGSEVGASTRRHLVDAAMALQAPKSAGMYQTKALVAALDADESGLKALLSELEASSLMASSEVITDAVAMAMLEACKASKAHDVVARVLELYRKTNGADAAPRVLLAACSALASCDRMASACEFYEKEIMTKGILPDAALAATLLKAASQRGLAAVAQHLAEHTGSMRGQGGSVAELQRQAAVIKAHARERNLEAAKAVFDRLKSSGKELPAVIHNCYLDALAHCGDHEGCRQHFEEMNSSGLVDIVGYNTMLKSLLIGGRTNDARALVKQMAQQGIQANRVTYNELLHSKVSANDRKGMWDTIDEMHGAGLKVNSVSCSILLKSLGEHSSAVDVRRIVDLMDEIEEDIDEVLLSSVVEACIRIRQLDALSDLLHRIKVKGVSICLAAPTYGSMIKAYGQAGDLARVRELWSEMQERGVKPTPITLGCMTEALVQNSQAEEAFQLLHNELESEHGRSCINTVIYSTVLKGFAFARRVDKVFAVYKEMRGNDVPCNTITYNTMLEACAKCSAMSRASSLLQDMKEAGVTPDIITYSTIIKGYCIEGDVDRAFSILAEMKKDDKFAPDEIMYNSILDGCAKQHRVEDAMRLLDEMKANGIRPSNYTLSILVKLLGHARRLGQALRMVDDVSKQNGFRPNVQVYTCLVQACILNRRLQQALELHETMVSDASCRVDDKFYAVLAKGCLQMKEPLKAVQVVRAAYQLAGHGLGESARKGRPIGIEAAALAEVAARLEAGSKEEREALSGLRAELQRIGVDIGQCHGRSRNVRPAGAGGTSSSNSGRGDHQRRSSGGTRNSTSRTAGEQQRPGGRR
eukprot:TRINITY_DN18654_c1_g2_i1.p1 TRINITY_DN18654_c1_g2~~TRINITY_DN18654_c1_g2_i1.p1  ORF type:complete len:1124 (-),score=225.40 TRINITY_DN18654_c1_g2_i1:67-2994(-)